jgi:hypothetical protein
MKRTQTLGRIAVIAAPALVAVFTALLIGSCDVFGDSDDKPTPSVISVTITPSMPTIIQGESQNFVAEVAVTGGASSMVDWSVEGALSSGTVIEESSGDGGGRLTVALDEAAQGLTVIATSSASDLVKERAVLAKSDAHLTKPVPRSLSNRLTDTATVGKRRICTAKNARQLRCRRTQRRKKKPRLSFFPLRSSATANVVGARCSHPLRFFLFFPVP